MSAEYIKEQLNIAGIETSFVLFPTEDKVMISARSMGETNVQVILEKLGGGGNAATAGAQVPSTDISEVTQQLLISIDQFFETD